MNDDGVPVSFRRAFEGKSSVLIEKLNVDEKLLNQLTDDNLITDEQRSIIQVEKVPGRRARKLLDELLRADDSRVHVFLEALVICNQRQVINLILGRNTDNMEFLRNTSTRFIPSHMKHTDRIPPVVDHPRRMTSCLTVTSVLVVLVGVGLFCVIYTRPSTTETSTANTDSTNQGSQQNEQNEEQNLFRAAFKNCRAKLVEEIDVRFGLLLHLRDKEVLTGWQIETIQSQQTHSEMVERMLELLEKRDNIHFKGFCDALIATEQRPIVDKHFRKYYPKGK